MELIYKYSTWKKKREEYRDSLLEKNSIYFSSAVNFNDPFDSCLPLRYKDGYEGSKMFYLDYINKLTEKTGQKLSYSDAVNLADKLSKSVTISEGQKKELENEYYKYMTQQVGVSCFSKNPSSILMWSHYADCHRGICLGFDKMALESLTSYIFHKMKYGTEFYRFTKFGDSQETLDYLLTKFEDWSYEDEYRLLLLDSANASIQFPKTMLKEVIIGMKMQESIKNELIAYLNKAYPHITIKHATRNYKGFRIDLNV